MKDVSNLKSKKIYIPSYQIPKTFVDDLQAYNYNLFSKISCSVFLITIFLIPITLDLLTQYCFPENNWLSLLKLIPYIFGFCFLFSKESKKFISSGAWGIYLYFLSQIVIGFLLMIATIFVSKEVVENKITISIITIFIQAFTHIIVIFLVLYFSPELRNRLFNTLGYNFLLVIITCAIAFFIFTNIDVIFKVLKDFFEVEKSENQKFLENIFNNNLGKIAVFISAILVAPLIEELAMRHSLFMLSGNRWLGLIFSTFYFAFMHVSGVNSNKEPELVNIFSYLGLSLVISLVFVISRENVAYSYILHLINNLLAMIILLG